MVTLLGSPLGDRVIALRERRGWSQKELAYEARVKREWLSTVETGRVRTPGAVPLQRVADALGTTPRYLVTGEDPGEEIDVAVPREDAGEVRRFAQHPSWLKRALNTLADQLLKDVPQQQRDPSAGDGRDREQH